MKWKKVTKVILWTCLRLKKSLEEIAKSQYGRLYGNLENQRNFFYKFEVQLNKSSISKTVELPFEPFAYFRVD